MRLGREGHAEAVSWRGALGRGKAVLCIAPRDCAGMLWGFRENSQDKNKMPARQGLGCDAAYGMENERKEDHIFA